MVVLFVYHMPMKRDVTKQQKVQREERTVTRRTELYDKNRGATTTTDTICADNLNVDA